MSKIIRIFISLFLASYMICIVTFAFGNDGEGFDYYSPDNVYKFAEYLYKEGDYLRAAGEYQRYLLHYQGSAGDVFLKIGNCYRLAGLTGKAIAAFEKVTESKFCFPASYQIAYTYFLSKQHENSIEYINKALDDVENTSQRNKLQILLALNHLHLKRWDEVDNILDSSVTGDSEFSDIAFSFKTSAYKGANLPRKNPVFAGLLSAIVPGTGKFYCGQFGDGIYSFFLTGLTGFLAWDGFRDTGVRSIRGWVFGGMCGVFYTGNVYGSAVAARAYNYHLESDLLMSLPRDAGGW